MKDLKKDDIRKILKDVDKDKISHVLICLDTYDYEYFIKYVKRDDDIDIYISNFWKIHKGGMFKIKEVYNMNLDIEMQLEEVRSYHVEKEQRKILEKYPELETNSEKALRFATEKHKGQLRKGEDKIEYITHPINVANLVKKYKESHKMDSLVAAAYLHDTLEDTDTTFYELVNKFGLEVASLVKEVTTDKDLKNEIGKAKYLAIKMKNITDWGLVIKLCDRLDNISSLDKVDVEFRCKYVNETIYIINYLMNNRKLTYTQIKIIKDIINVLNVIIMYTYDDESTEKTSINSLLLTLKEKEVSIS